PGAVTDRSPPLVVPPRPGSKMFVFKETEHPDGGAPRTFAFTDVDILPRGYDELAKAKLHAAVTIPLEMFNGRIVDTDVEGVDLSKYAHITATLESPFTAKAIGLVRGGWLPSALAATREHAVVLPDRNIVSEIAGRFENGRKTGREPDFLDLFASEPVRINPLLFAMEGNSRTLPDPASAQAQLEEAVAKIGSALPKAELMIGPMSLTGLLGLIEDTGPGLARKQVFLRGMAPTLAAPVARAQIDRRWSEVLAAADANAVPRSSLVVLAVLSTLVNPGKCAAKKLLKFHAGYGDTDAYNALCDLRSLDILLHCLAFYPDHDTQLCTADRNLALFWTGLQATNIARDGQGIRYTMTPHEALLPGAYGERWAEAVNRS
ncbi:MAG: hypothetical protein P1U62_14200, partial [Alteraurantiacibacter sp. bin_em_oilr2.035]|nr:hypothetical protein [Alteraurantiacibacter sp. bin_em_oilr2.035]